MFPFCWWWWCPTCWAEMTSWLCWTLTGHSGPPVGTLLTVMSKSWIVNHFRHMIFQGHCMHRTSPHMKSLDCNDDHWLRVRAIRECFYESFALKQMPFTPTLFSQNCPNKLYTDCSSMGPSPTYGCMRIFGRENPYICVIGTISGYIWQYICGRPYAVSGAAYSTSLLQGGPLIHQFSWRRSAEHCNL